MAMRSSPSSFQHLDKQLDFLAVYPPFVHDRTIGWFALLCACRLFASPFCRIHQGGHCPLFLDIWLLCLEELAVDHFRTYQSDATSPDFGRGDADIW